MGSTTVASQTARLRAVADVVRELGGTAPIDEVARRLGLASSDGIYYRIRRAVEAGVVIADNARPGLAKVLTLPPVEVAPVVESPQQRAAGWEGVIARAVARREEITALDAAAYLNLASAAAARQRLRPLVLDGRLAYDAAADTYRAGPGRERAA